MNRTVALGIAVTFLIAGFVLGRVTAPTEPHGEKATADLESHLASSKERIEPSGADSDGRRSSLETISPGGIKGATEPRASSEHLKGHPAVGEEDEPSTVGAPEESATPQEPNFDVAMELLTRIEEALEDGNAEALKLLAEPMALQAEFVVPELVALLESADSLFAKENLARLLGATLDPEALPVVQDLLQNEENAEVRTAAIQALGQIPDASSVPLLEAEFSRESDSPMPPSLAASSLGKIDTPEAVSALKNEVTVGTNRMVQSFALRALAELKDPDLIPFFLEQVQRTEGASERFRKSAIDAIGQTGDASAIGQLEAIVSSEGQSQSIRESAMRAINRIAGEPIYDIR